MKKILWIYTGGTIACTESYSENGERTGLSPKKDGNDVTKFLDEQLSLIPDFSGSIGNIDVTARELFSLDSSNIKPSHWLALSREVFSAREDFDGFVITHGTDTMQHSAAALSVMLKDFDKPVIFTGSQKPFGEEESDAPFNFVSAFICAAALQHGVFICFCGRIISGESAVKLYSRRADAFADVKGDAGRVYADKGGYKVKLFKETLPCGAAPILRDKLCENVFYLKLTPNTNSDIIDYIKEKGCRGVVCEVFGLGGIPDDIISGLESLCQDNVKVVAVSQCLYEGADLGVYTVGVKADAAGIKSGENMTGSYALVRLMVELGEDD